MNEAVISPEEFARYQRQMTLPGFGSSGQLKLKQARVLVVGAGALGAPLLLYLTAAGVGTIGICDFDAVEASNLHRQVLFTRSDVGRSKVEVAIARLKVLNPDVQFIAHEEKLSRDNAQRIFSGYDVVADGTDNFPTRYLVNDAAVLSGVVNVFASIFRFEGQCSVFNLPLANGKRGPNYRDLFPQPPAAETVMDCAEGGVLGALPGIIGAMQATEVIKVIAGIGEPLSGKLFIWNALNFESQLLHFTTDDQNPLTGLRPTQTGLIDYDAFCGVNAAAELEISADTFAQWQRSSSIAKLIDIREAQERELLPVNAEAMAVDEMRERLAELPAQGQIVILCSTGKRSLQMVKWLRVNAGMNNVVSLKGGTGVLIK